MGFFVVQNRTVIHFDLIVHTYSGGRPWSSGSVLDSRVEGRGFDTALGKVSSH